MTHPNQSSLDDEAVKAIGNFTFRHLVAITEQGPPESVSISSGVCIQIEGHSFVATAAHHLRKIADDRLVVVHAGRPPNTINEVIRRSPQYSTRGNPHDLGYLEIDPSQFSEKNFLPLSAVLPNAPCEEKLSYLINGYPAEVVPGDLAERGITALGAMCFALISVDPGSIEDSEPDRDVFLKYDESGRFLEDDSTIDTPHPGGMSGCGIWGLPPSTKGAIWSPKTLRLIGTQVGYRPRTRLIRGVQIQHWLQLISTDYPDLNDALASILDR